MKFGQSSAGPWLRFAWGHGLFAILSGLILLGSAGIVLVHLGAITQIELMNEDLWYRNIFTFSNFWRTSAGVHFAPSLNLTEAFTNAFLPAWGWASHLQMMALNALCTGLAWRWFRQKLKCPVWLAALGLGFFFSLPILHEGTYWIWGAHSLHSLLWFLGAMNTLPAPAQRERWQAWSLHAICLLFLLSSSPVTYGAFFLLAFYRFWEAGQRPRQRWFWGIVIFLGILYFYPRNFLINGSGWVFTYQGAPEYASPPERSWRMMALSLVALLEYSHPLIALGRHWPQGYLTFSEYDLGTLFHLLWLGPLWLWLIADEKKQARELFLYGAGGAGTLMLLSPYTGARYQVLIAFVQVAGLILIIRHWIHPLQVGRKIILASFALMILGLNSWAKVVTLWEGWILPDQLEESILTITSKASPAQRSLVFVVNRPVNLKLYAGGADAGLGGLRLILDWENSPHCLYYAYRQGATPEEQEIVLWHNSRNWVDESYRLKHSKCPPLPQTNEAILCYVYDEKLGWKGGFRPLEEVVTLASAIPEAHAPPSSRVQSQTVTCAPHS